MTLSNLPAVFRAFKWSGLVVIVCASILGATAYATHAKYSKLILPNVYIAGTSVSGLDQISALTTLQKQVDELLNKGLNIELGNETKNIPLTLRGANDPDVVYQLIDIDITTAVNDALKIGRSENRFISFFSPLWYLIFGKNNIEPPITIAETRLIDTIKAAFPNAESAGTPTDFVVSWQPTGDLSVDVVEAVPGSTIDTKTDLRKLRSDVSDLSLGTLHLHLVERGAELSADEARTLIPEATQALKNAPYILTFTKDDGTSLVYTISQKDLSIWLKPVKDETDLPQLGLDTEAMLALRTDIHTAIDISAKDAKFSVEDNKVTEFIPSRDGLTVDDDLLLASLLEAFSKNESNQSIILSVKRTEPSVPIASANSYGIKEKIGQAITSYSGSPKNRRANIKHGAEKLNGILIAPGETLSLIEKLKPFTLEDGYLAELVIKGDEIIPEIAGGLCQIGTTTFRAAMNSGLDIVERRNHSLVVSYYNDPSNNNPGTDATIYDPAPDLKIKNDFGSYIMLVTEVNEEKSELTFTFWGTNDGRTGSYTPPQVLSWTKTGAPIEKFSDKLAAGQRSCQAAHPGATTSFDYNITYGDGTTFTENYTSTYRALPQVCLVGRGTDSSSAEVTTE